MAGARLLLVAEVAGMACNIWLSPVRAMRVR
jgi:hypothetical protein